MRYAVQILILFIALTRSLFPLNVGFRFSEESGMTRIVFEGNQKFTYKITAFEDRLEIELPQAIVLSIDAREAAKLNSSQVVAGVSHETPGGQSLIRIKFRDGYKILKHFILENPFRLVFDMQRATRAKAAGDAPAVVKETPPPTAAAEKLQLAMPPAVQDGKAPAAAASKKKPIETICIDAGHGGGDLGAVSKSGAVEKSLTLEIAHKLKSLVESKLGLRVIMSRDKDEEVSLNSRASVANNQQAQMFVSIHVNSSFRRAAFGSETYFVSLNATDQDALALAQKENSSNDNIGQEIQNDELKLILWNMAQTEYIKESSKLAEFIQFELNELLGTRNRGVKQAPFRVLMRAAMPSVLIEVAFLSNRTEEKKLLDNDFQNKVALAVFSGISKFIAYYNSSLK